MNRAATRRELIADIKRMGVGAGDILMVHASVRSIGPILGGVNELVEALLESLASGTLVAYVDWELGFPDDIDPAQADDIPAFDKRTARAARAYGIFPEVLRTWPGAVRSDNPEAGIVAVGHHASWLCEDHSLSYGYGERSPYAKLVSAGAKIFVIGAPLETITLLHHAEHIARLDGKRVRRYRRKMRDAGISRWVDFEEFDSSEAIVAGMPADHFARIARHALAERVGNEGQIGNAHAYLFPAAELHAVGVRWLETWRP